MKASKQRIEEIEEERVIQEICNAIGERRVKDLVDIISKIESSSDWQTAVEYLLGASKKEYPIPVGSTSIQTMLEPLKFREVLFDLFGCAGLEPIFDNTERLLHILRSSRSFIDAQSLFKSTVESAALESISHGNSLFFDIEFIHSDISDELRKSIGKAHEESVKDLRFEVHDGSIDILPFWYTEYGRLALSELGISTTSISVDEFEMVLSVLHVSKGIKEHLRKSIDQKSDKSHSISNPLYNDLLNSIISVDIETMQELGSRHACPTLNHELRKYVDDYKATKRSNEYRNLLKILRSHIAVRWVDSVIAISELVEFPDNRIVYDTIRTLGNFYYESTISTLLGIYCNTTQHEVRCTILDTISHLRMRCPEAKTIVLDMLHRDCPFLDELRIFYHRTWM